MSENYEEYDNAMRDFYNCAVVDIPDKYVKDIRWNIQPT